MTDREIDDLFDEFNKLNNSDESNESNESNDFNRSDKSNEEPKDFLDEDLSADFNSETDYQKLFDFFNALDNTENILNLKDSVSQSLNNLNFENNEESSKSKKPRVIKIKVDKLSDLEEIVDLLNPLNYLKDDSEFQEWINLARLEVQKNTTEEKKTKVVSSLTKILKELEKREEYKRCKVVYDEIQFIEQIPV